jgi:hypothetical protein
MRLQAMVEEERRQTGKLSTTELCEMAASGLVPMLDPERRIFCDIFNRTEKGMVREGLSPRYTMMTLLGLYRYEQSGRRSPVEIESVLSALMRNARLIQGAGDLGLLLWTCAELAPEQVPQLYLELGAHDALTRFADGIAGYTMEVAWYLTGLASCYLAGHTSLPGWADAVKAACSILEQNCGTSGVYGHLARRRFMRGFQRGRIGSFADQVYPTIALAKLAQAMNDDKARQHALRTARTMCELQGELGEWCWQYDSSRGNVLSRYPVYSVHQHAMGPMMLFAVEEATGIDFSDAIYRGLAWISGTNELHRDFVEPSLGLVWRCIYLDPTRAYADAAMRFVNLCDGAADPRRLKIRHECRPYELGWMLYAFAGR